MIMFERRLNIILLLFSILAVTSFLIVFFNLNFFFATILQMSLPACCFLILNKKRIKKILFFALPFGVVGTTILETAASVYNMWWEPTIFGFRFFGTVSIEVLIWGISLSIFVISFYELLLKDKSVFKPKVKSLAFFLGMLTVIYVVFITFDLRTITPYIYLLMGIVLGAPSTIHLVIKKWGFYKKLLKVVPIFFTYFLVHEVIALNLNLWEFPGDYILKIVLFGAPIPAEEIIFWLVLFQPALYALYKRFV